jgi:ABC-type multidrug transport system fused ATPase/permease subunit
MANQRKQAVSLENLGRKGLFSINFLLTLVLVGPMVGVLFELLVAKTPFPVFLVRVGLGTLLVSIALYLYGLLSDRYIDNTSIRAWTSGAVVFAAGAFRAVSMNYVEAAIFGTAIPSNPYRPLIAGAGLYFAFACMALVNGIRKDYLENLTQFISLAAEIESFKLSAERRMSEESKKLRRRAQEALLPLLTRLELHLAEADSSELKMELRTLLTENIRPLSQRFSRHEQLKIGLKRIRISQPRAFASIPSKFKINSAIYPSLSAVLVGPTLLAVAIYVFGIQALVPYLLVLTISWLIGKALTQIVPDKPLNTALVVLIAMIYSALLWGAMLIILSFIVTGQLVAPSVLVAVLIPSITFSLTLVLVSFFAGNVRTNSDQIDQLNREYEIYRSYVNQKIWVARRNWSYVIHGSVQSSVTLAITRLTNKTGKPSKKVLTAIASDLNSAKTALDRDLTTEIVLSENITALIETWKGVCSVRVEICPEVEKLTRQPSEFNFGLNELLKEIVSNAFRHGEAKNVWISLDQFESNVIRITAKNDGLPVPDDFKTNIGVAMYNELGVDWSIKSPDKKRGAVLTVDVAI